MGISYIMRLTDREIDENIIHNGFYALVSKKFGYRENPDTDYNFEKIFVSDNIMKAWRNYYKSQGYDEERISVILDAAPRVDVNLVDNHVQIQSGFIYENGVPLHLEDHYSLIVNDGTLVRSILCEFIEQKPDENTEDVYKKMTSLISRAITDADSMETISKRGQDLMQAYVNGNIDDFCVALTGGYSFLNVLKKAMIIPQNMLV